MSFRRRTPALITERKHGRLVDYLGDRARVVFADGKVVALPAGPFRDASVQPAGFFVIVARRRSGGRELVEVRVHRIAQKREQTPRLTTPKVLMRDGRSVTTRR